MRICGDHKTSCAFDPLPKADAIVVLGCTPSARLRWRVERGVRLYQKSVAPLLLLSGGGSGPEPEAEIMRRTALACGAPPAALLIEPHSRDTLGNARETSRLLRSHRLRTVVLVSDRVHLPRAALLFRLAGVEIVGRSAVRSRSLPKEIGATIREMAALLWSLARVILQR
jgi:uncharacterized SAM-binding protein YcdF (DUF218 family)